MRYLLLGLLNLHFDKLRLRTTALKDYLRLPVGFIEQGAEMNTKSFISLGSDENDSSEVKQI